MNHCALLRYYRMSGTDILNSCNPTVALKKNLPILSLCTKLNPDSNGDCRESLALLCITTETNKIIDILKYGLFFYSKQHCIERKTW